VNLKVEDGLVVLEQRRQTKLRERRGEISQLSFKGSIQLIVVELFKTRAFPAGRGMAPEENSLRNMSGGNGNSGEGHLQGVERVFEGAAMKRRGQKCHQFKRALKIA
jgi:hypothetical protein